MSLTPYATMYGLPAPVTTGTTIQSFTDVSGEVWVAKNGVSGGAWKRARDAVHCVMYRNTTWALTGTATVVQFDTAYRDVYGMWGGSPNYGIIAPIPGWYRVFGQMNGTQATASAYLTLQIWQNAVQRGLTNTISPLASGGISTRGWWLGQLATNDYVSIRCAQSGTAGNIQLGVSNNRLELSYLGTG